MVFFVINKIVQCVLYSALYSVLVFAGIRRFMRELNLDAKSYEEFCLMQYNIERTGATSSLGNALEGTRSVLGGRGGSMGRALASRSNGFYDQRFEPRQEHKKNVREFFRVKNVVLTCCWCIRTHKNDHVRTLIIL